MRYLKMLGLAAIAAAALSAVWGAGSASATVLCRTYTIPCGEFWAWPTEITLKSSLEPGSSLVIRDTAGNVLTTCTGSSLESKITKKGSAVETVVLKNEKVSPGECTSTTHVVANGELEVHYAPSPNNTRGTLTLKGTKITITRFGVGCNIVAGAGSDIGTVTAPGPPNEHATLDVEGVLFVEAESILCPGHVVLEAKFNVTEPTRVYVKNS